MKIDLINTIENEFKNKPSFTKEELVNILSNFFSNEKTITWRIHDLKVKGVINHLQRGVYSLGGKKQYIPAITEKAKAIYTTIIKELPYTSCCIIETSWFNEFMRHQVFKTYLIIEVEKDASKVIFSILSAAGEKVFLNPDAQIFENYISSTENPIIVKSLIGESPIKEVEKIKIATLEKMLVDMICDTAIYSAQEGEINNIFKAAIEKYNINLKRMLRYARRRNKANEIDNYYHVAI